MSGIFGSQATGTKLCYQRVKFVFYLQIMIVFIILFGTTKFGLSYSEYVTLLTLMGFMTGVTLFCWIVIFTFRKNLLMESEISLRPEMGQGGPKSVVDPSGSPSAPPPAYSEIEGWRCGEPSEPREEPGPPGYDVVMSQVSQPVLRKKSLTNHAVWEKPTRDVCIICIN